MTPTHTSAETVAHAIAYAMIDAKMLVDPDAHAAVEALILRHVEPLIERERLEAKIEQVTEMEQMKWGILFKSNLDYLRDLRAQLAAHPRREEGTI